MSPSDRHRPVSLVARRLRGCVELGRRHHRAASGRHRRGRAGEPTPGDPRRPAYLTSFLRAIGRPALPRRPLVRRALITQAGTDAHNVVGLVFIAAFSRPRPARTRRHQRSLSRCPARGRAAHAHLPERQRGPATRGVHFIDASRRLLAPTCRSSAARVMAASNGRSRWRRSRPLSPAHPREKLPSWSISRPAITRSIRRERDMGKAPGFETWRSTDPTRVAVSQRRPSPSHRPGGEGDELTDRSRPKARMPSSCRRARVVWGV